MAFSPQVMAPGIGVLSNAAAFVAGGSASAAGGSANRGFAAPAHPGVSYYVAAGAPGQGTSFHAVSGGAQLGSAAVSRGVEGARGASPLVDGDSSQAFTDGDVWRVIAAERARLAGAVGRDVLGPILSNALIADDPSGLAVISDLPRQIISIRTSAPGRGDDTRRSAYMDAIALIGHFSRDGEARPAACANFNEMLREWGEWNSPEFQSMMSDDGLHNANGSFTYMQLAIARGSFLGALKWLILLDWLLVHGANSGRMAEAQKISTRLLMHDTRWVAFRSFAEMGRRVFEGGSTDRVSKLWNSGRDRIISSLSRPQSVRDGMDALLALRAFALFFGSGIEGDSSPRPGEVLQGIRDGSFPVPGYIRRSLPH